MNQVTKNSGIVISVEDKELIGRISHLSLKDITVEMIYPYPGIKRGLHIPHFDYKKTFNDNNIQGYAESLLLEIYNSHEK